MKRLAMICMVLLLMAMLSGLGKAEAYLIDVGAIRLGQYTGGADSSGWAGVYLDSLYDFKDVNITLTYLSGQTTDTKMFSSTNFAATLYMSDPILELLTPLNSDDSANISSIVFSGSLANNTFLYGSGSVKATGAIQTFWEYFDGDLNTLTIPPQFLGLSDFAFLRVDVEDNIQPVPEPSTIMLLAAGALGLIGIRRRR